MEQPVVYYNKVDYMVTPTGNTIARTCVLAGTDQISAAGKCIMQHNCILRGDLAVIKMGRSCILKEGAIIRPPYKRFRNEMKFFAMQIGDCVMIGEGSVVSAAQIGSYVEIGKNCVIGRRAVLKDCCRIADNSFVPPDTVVAPFSNFEGSPAEHTTDVPLSWQETMSAACRTYYEKFVPK
eukprot:comp6591_c0_seq1/m.2365 comp6591_c0_seq1/g.2365  ORF comp6591_c0_seq1/g.2365 comp6591_c0_seq1/m.2365 type:complete len:180 (-) comp6591_c0_seq1:77-616(-)